MTFNEKKNAISNLNLPIYVNNITKIKKEDYHHKYFFYYDVLFALSKRIVI